MKLPDGYEIKSMSEEEFGPLWTKHAKAIFTDSQPILNSADILTEADLQKSTDLKKRLKEILKLRFALFYKDQFAGWSWGVQQGTETFNMCNSAVLPEHRRKGLYTALMNTVVHAATEAGFRRIFSRHSATNNAVIIAKLKAGFNITTMELSESFGTLVHLTYFPNPTRRKVLEYRAGLIRPDEEIKKLLRF